LKTVMLNLYDVSELKKLLENQGGAVIHMHDTCGGQYFSLENGDPNSRAVIEKFVEAKKLKAVFNPSSDGFTVIKKK
jgi:hypothetical protein